AGFDPMVIGTLRLAIGGVSMLLIVLLTSGVPQLKSWPLKATLSAALFTALYQAFFFAGVAKTGVAVGTIVGIGSAPVAGGLLGYFFRGERPGRNWFVATALALIGCVVLTLSSGGDVVIDLMGVALAIGAGVAYAAYTLVIKGLLEKHDANAVIAVVFCIGALMLAPLLIGREMAWLAAPRSIAVILHLGLVTAALAYWLFARGLQRVPVATAVTLTLAEPLTAGLLGLLVLGEQLNPVSFVGIALIFSGLAVLSLVGRATPEVPAEFGG
ncbi:MAG TPA: EamA family transporter, partial [Desulfuromonadales bacterium]|nr:EamA family transporter [Desulfuromonadales bacterium]